MGASGLTLPWLTDDVLGTAMDECLQWDSFTGQYVPLRNAHTFAAMRRVLEAAAQEAETPEPVAWIVYWDAPYTPKTGERCRRVHLSKNDAEFECRAESAHNSFIVPLYEKRPATTEQR